MGEAISSDLRLGLGQLLQNRHITHNLGSECEGLVASIDNLPLLSCVAQHSQFHNDLSQLTLLLFIQFGPFFGGTNIHTPAVKILQSGISNALHLEIVNVPSGIVARQQILDLIG